MVILTKNFLQYRLSEAVKAGQVLPHLPGMGHGWRSPLQVDDSMLKKMGVNSALNCKRIRAKYKTFIETSQL